MKNRKQTQPEQTPRPPAGRHQPGQDLLLHQPLLLGRNGPAGHGQERVLGKFRLAIPEPVPGDDKRQGVKGFFPAGGHLSPRLRWLGAAETDEEKKPSPGRGWQGEALTGVGRCRVGLGTAPLPAPGGHLPLGEGWRAAGSRPTVFPVHPGLPRKRWLFPLIRQGPWP